MPGGPASSTPCGMRPPRRPVLLGVAQEVDDLAQLGLRLLDAGDVGEGDAVAGRLRSAARATVRTQPSTFCTLPARRSSQNSRSEEQDRRPEPEQQGLPPGRRRCRAAWR